VKVMIAGASGFLGQVLRQHLIRNGHIVHVLVRRPAAAPTETEWQPAQHSLAANALVGLDAVVCLSGAGIGDKRWTPEYKGVLRASRVDSTSTIAQALTALSAAERPRVFLSGSAMGVYGDRRDVPLPETAAAGTGFLSDLARDWEAATAPAAQVGVRVVLLRTSHVLAASGGLLKRMVPVYRLGVGGRLGSGEQYMSWITLADWASAVLRLLEHEDVRGPVNVSSPEPVRNSEFSKALGSALHRPSLLAVPKVAMRVIAGELANQGALASQRLVPLVLQEIGFEYRHPTLATALDWAVLN
jgi:uncharacterized protein (TIGR01777 family)